MKFWTLSLLSHSIAQIARILTNFRFISKKFHLLNIYIFTILSFFRSFYEISWISGKPSPFRVFYLQAKDTGRLATTAFQGARRILPLHLDNCMTVPLRIQRREHATTAARRERALRCNTMCRHDRRYVRNAARTETAKLLYYYICK